MTSRLSTYLLVFPLAVVLIVFVGIPLLSIIVISFFDFDGIRLISDITLLNYQELFDSRLVWILYWKTLRFAGIVWLFSVVIGVAVSQFLVFHVRTLPVQIGLFLLCTIPFWTSSIIRMISWLPVLGTNGLINNSLVGIGLIDEPIKQLIFSDLSVIIVYIHSFSLFMIVPIFNSMARISPTVIEAAREAGASRWQIMTNIIVPLSKAGIALGSIFVVALVMGDFFIVKVMSGGQSATVALAISNKIGSFQYPQAAAESVLFLAVVMLFISGMLRVVDVRNEVLN